MKLGASTPNNNKYLIEQAYFYLNKRVPEPELAQGELNRVNIQMLNRQGKNSFYLAQAKCHSAKNKTADAIDAYKMISTAEGLAELISYYISLGKYNEAEREILKVRQFSTVPGLASLRNLLREKMGGRTNADLISVYKNTDNYLELAQCYVNLEQWDAASRTYRAANNPFGELNALLKIKPPSFVCVDRINLLFTNQLTACTSKLVNEDHSSARAILDNIQKILTDNNVLFQKYVPLHTFPIKMITCLEKLGLLRDAAQFSKGIINDTDANSRHVLPMVMARCYEARGEYETALAFVKTKQHLAPTEFPELELDRIRIMTKMGNIAAASLIAGDIFPEGHSSRYSYFERGITIISEYSGFKLPYLGMELDELDAIFNKMYLDLGPSFAASSSDSGAQPAFIKQFNVTRRAVKPDASKPIFGLDDYIPRPMPR